jgi:hypothetical protein
MQVLTEPLTDASGSTRFDLEISRTLSRRIDEMRVVLGMGGRDPVGVEAGLMASLPLRRAPEITISPAWWRWMPLIPFNISVTSK